MAAEETTFYPAAMAADSYSSGAAVGPESLLMKHSTPHQTYYRSLDNSVRRKSATATPAHLNSGGRASPGPLASYSYLDDSSDHEREEDREISSHKRSTGDEGDEGVQLLRDTAKGEDYNDRLECDKEDRLKDDWDKLPISLTCVLIPSCAVKNWKYCRICYCLAIAVLSLLILFFVSIAMFWGIEVVKYRSHIIESQDLSSSAVYNLTSDFPLSNIYSTKLCLNTQGTHVKKYSVDKLAYVSLLSEDCDAVTVSTNNESVSQDSIFGHNYMFYWLSGTAMSFFAKVNGSSTMSVFLLDSMRSFDLCTNHITPGPEDYKKMWAFNFSNCGLIPETGLMECRFHYEVTKSGYYFICINSTIENDLMFNISISSVAYNTSNSKVAVECMPSEECCVPFDSIFVELYRPTCMFVTTEPLSSAYSGIKLTEISVRVEQRLEVIWYCITALVPVLLIFVGTILLCKTTSRKVKTPDLNGRGCIINCKVYNNGHNVNRL